MQGLRTFCAGKVGVFSSVVLGLVIAGGISTIQAQTYTFGNLNSSMSVNVSGPSAGMDQWLVDGVNQVAVQWDWFRIGSTGGESMINSLSLTPTIVTNANSLDVTYNNGSYSARVVYTLTGGSLGSGHSSLNESITFQNKSGSSENLHFFDYSDYNLAGVAPGQTLQMYQSGGLAGTNAFWQVFGAATLTNTTISGFNPPTLFQADGPTSVLNSLNDSNPTTLNNTPSATGDVSGTLEWDLTLANNGALTISKVVSLQVPEPSTAALLGVGFLLLRSVGANRRKF